MFTHAEPCISLQTVQRNSAGLLVHSVNYSSRTGIQQDISEI